MFLAFILSGLNRLGAARRRFVWSPALDLRDGAIRSALIPGAQY
jgi:hypothetical protein